MTTTTKTMVISTDSHVNEPPELWRERLSEDLKHRAPHKELRDGVEYFIVEGTWPRKMPGGRTKLRGELDLDISQYGGWDPEHRIRDQDRDGVTGEIIYPSNGLNVFISPDPALQIGMARAYNDWSFEVFGKHLDRLIPAAIIPTVDVDLAVAEVQRVAKMGHRALFLPPRVVGENRRQYNDQMYDPMWAAIQETGLTANFHCGAGHDPRGERGPGGAIINYLLHAQGDGPFTVTYLCASGVLQRFPGIHFVTVETGAGWLGWIMEHMDLIYHDHQMWVSPKLDMLPSEYWKRQGHTCFMNDHVAVNNRHFTGVQTLLWGNDYPHHEGTWPHSQKAIDEMFAGVPDDEKRQIIGGTAAKIYGFPV